MNHALAMHSKVLDGGLVFKDLDEDVDGEADQGEADGHVKDRCHPVADFAPWRQRLQAVRRKERPLDYHVEKDSSGTGLIEAEQEEWFHVMIANAISDPRAVVVHLGNADPAVLAVVGALRLPPSAVLADFVLSFVFDVRYPCWLLQTGDPVAEQGHRDEEVEQKL